MSLEFHKMHGAGNDFILIDARKQDLEMDRAMAERLADRHRGIGCDQILILRQASEPGCVLRYEIWNSDGSPAAQCGNGARCVGLYIHLNGDVAEDHFSVESPVGVITMLRCEDGEYELGMGIPEFEPDQVPITLEPFEGSYHLDSPWGELDLGAVSVGVPHALVVCDDIDDENLPAMGGFVRAHPAFPEGVNAGFAQLRSRNRIHLRVIERGAGETLACGSGACAAVAILHRAGRVDDTVTVVLPGGQLVIKWRGNDETLYMKGPAKHVFRGIMNE
jgi:diaminopimelate epimerase